jgi:hypothetical protein
VTALGAAVLAPAAASTGPATNADGNDLIIAIQGPNNSLKLFWSVFRTNTWYPKRSPTGATPTPRPP